MPVSRQEADRLILKFWPRLPQLVHYFPQFSRYVDDPIGVASLGLVEAGRTFEPGRCEFSSWAYRKVRTALKDEARKSTRLKRTVVTYMPLDDEQVAERRPFRGFADLEARHEVERLMIGRGQSTQAAIRLFLTGRYDPREIGPALGLGPALFAWILSELRRCPYRLPLTPRPVRQPKPNGRPRLPDAVHAQHLQTFVAYKAFRAAGKGGIKDFLMTQNLSSGEFQHVRGCRCIAAYQASQRQLSPFPAVDVDSAHAVDTAD